MTEACPITVTGPTIATTGTRCSLNTPTISTRNLVNPAQCRPSESSVDSSDNEEPASRAEKCMNNYHNYQDVDRWWHDDISTAEIQHEIRRHIQDMNDREVLVCYQQTHRGRSRKISHILRAFLRNFGWRTQPINISQMKDRMSPKSSNNRPSSHIFGKNFNAQVKNSLVCYQLDLWPMLCSGT